MLRKLDDWWFRFNADAFLDGYVGERDIELEGFSKTVQVFQHDEMLGFGGISGRIRLNEKLFDEPDISLKHVYLHEIGHTRQNILLNFSIGFSQWLLQPKMLLLSFLLALISAFQIFKGILNIVSNDLGTLIFSSISIIYFVCVLVSQIGEVDAQIFAISKIGEEKFREAMKHHEDKKTKRNMIEAVSWQLRYPSSESVLKIYRLLN